MGFWEGNQKQQDVLLPVSLGEAALRMPGGLQQRWFLRAPASAQRDLNGQTNKEARREPLMLSPIPL